LKTYYCLLTLLYIIALPFSKAVAQLPSFEEQIFPSPASEITLVNGMAADANNCVWFSTQSGIYRYDGNRFKNYSTLNNASIKFERMEAMRTVLRDNKLSWCISDAKGNLYYIDSSGKLQTFIHKKGSTEILFGKNFFQIWKDEKKYELGVEKGIEYKVFYNPTQNKFYIATNAFIRSISRKDVLAEKTPSTIDSTIWNDVKLERFFTIGKGFFGISPKGIFRFNEASASPKSILLDGDILNIGNKLDYEGMLAFTQADQNSVLIWYKGNIYEGKESVAGNGISTRLLAKGLPANTPSYIYYSPEHHLLLGCFLYKGMVLYQPRQFSLLQHKGVNAKKLDYYYVLLPFNNGYITVNNTGIVWLGLNGSSKLLYKGRFNVFFLHIDRTGNIWYQKYNEETQIWQIAYLEAGTLKPVSVLIPEGVNELTGVYQPNDSTYYLLTNFSFQKIIFTNRKLSSQQLFYNKPYAEAFTVLFQKDSTTLWLGHDQGLMEFNLKDHKLKPVTELNNAYIRSIIKLPNNSFLVGTYNKWIYQYKNNQWTHLSPTDKTTAPSVHGFIPDYFTNSLWYSSNRGVSRMSLQEVLTTSGKDKLFVEHFTDFGQDISLEFNGSSNVSAARLSGTSAAFANANGLVVFNPRQSLSVPLPKTVLVEPVYDADSLAKRDSDARQLQFSVAVPYFGNRNNLEVLYKLTNTDNSWHTLYPNAIISYNNLTPGDHQLQFRIKHYSDPKEKEVFIVAGNYRMPYRWHETTAFKVSMLLLVLLAVVSFHYFRIWIILKRKKELEDLVKQKTSELLETNENLMVVIDELSHSEATLKQSNFLKDEYYAVLTHDLRSPLKFLTFNISQLLELLPEIKSEDLRKGLISAYECSSDVYKLVDEFIYWIQDNEKQLIAHPSPVSIDSVIEETKKIAGLSMEGNKNSFTTEIEPGLIFTTDPKLLFIILRNAIDNANKYTSNGTIKVSAFKKNGHLELVISDTGIGISEDQVNQLMNLQYSKEQLSYKQRKSLGFYIMAMLTKILGGKYLISSSKEKGTSVSFSLPELKEA
jgi:signal transduction histidine kinase